MRTKQNKTKQNKTKQNVKYQISSRSVGIHAKKQSKAKQTRTTKQKCKKNKTRCNSMNTKFRRLFLFRRRGEWGTAHAAVCCSESTARASCARVAVATNSARS
jgi:hypothetical protein